MKKLLVGMVVTLMMGLLTACGGDEASEKETTTQNQQVKENESSEENETDESGEESSPAVDQSKLDMFSKEVSHNKQKLAIDGNGNKVTVVENFYVGDSGMSRYDIKIELANYRVINMSFEGPLGFSNQVTIEDSAIYMMGTNKDISMYFADMIYLVDAIMGETSVYAEELENFAIGSEFIENLKSTTTDEDMKLLFSMQEDSYVEVFDDEKVLIMDETPFNEGIVAAGYAGVKWFYEDPLFVLAIYGESVDTYNDENTMAIFNSMQWDYQ